MADAKELNSKTGRNSVQLAYSFLIFFLLPVGTSAVSLPVRPSFFFASLYLKNQAGPLYEVPHGNSVEWCCLTTALAVSMY